MKYKSTLFDEARNKIGSVVASKNRNGNYFRAKVTPKNPKTALQELVRGRFTVLSQAWRGLTDVQRLGWTSLGAQVKLHDPLGNTYTPTGQQLYLSCNTNLAIIGSPVLDDAPATPDASADLSNMIIVASILTAAPHTQTLTFAVDGGATSILAVNATAQFSAGRSFVGRSQYRLLQEDTHVPDGTAVDFLAEYHASFGNLVAGSKMSVTLHSISTHGFATRPIRQDVIVAAA